MRLHCRNLARIDRYFLLRYGLRRPDVENPWLFDRCREVQAHPWGYLDLWAREHYKSSAITFAGTIQDILASHGDDPLPEWEGREATICILSFSRPDAKKFLKQIRDELQSNNLLKWWFSDILYENPRAESPSWSLDAGLTVKRRSNPKEATIEAVGLMEGLPAGPHFSVLNYDDVINQRAVTDGMVDRATQQWELSINIGQEGGRKRYIGTRYAEDDTYATIMERGVAIPRLYPATEDGTPSGRPVFMSEEYLNEKRLSMGPFTFSCHGTGTLITMADRTQKSIEQVRVGDWVVGWNMTKEKKARLARTQVLGVQDRVAETVVSTLADGTVMVHTPDHRWYTGRRGKRMYSTLGFGHKQIGFLYQGVDLESYPSLTLEQKEVKEHRLKEHCYGANFRRSAGVMLQNQADGGLRRVWNIQTETGNYLANGFCSKNCQMLINPIPLSSVFFRREWFHWYWQRPSGLRYFMTSDYATLEGEGDWTVFVVYGVDSFGNIYLADLVRMQKTSNDWIDEAIDLGVRWNVKEWGEESGSIQKALDGVITQMMRERDVEINREAYPSITGKAARAVGIQARASAGKVYLPIQAEWLQDFLFEVLRFTAKGKNRVDDQVDAFGMAGRQVELHSLAHGLPAFNPIRHMRVVPGLGASKQMETILANEVVDQLYHLEREEVARRVAGMEKSKGLQPVIDAEKIPQEIYEPAIRPVLEKLVELFYYRQEETYAIVTQAEIERLDRVLIGKETT